MTLSSSPAAEAAATPPGRPFRVAVIGGGIGGLFCTLALQHHCAAAAGVGTGAVAVRIDVYEQADEFREIGAGVGLGANAVRLAHRLGLGEGLAAIAGHRRNGVWVAFRRYDNSEAVAVVREPPAPEPGVHHMPCARSDLLDVLRREALRRSGPAAATTLHTGKTCVGVDEEEEDEEEGEQNRQGREEPSGITVRFRDGTTAAADLVVGCDGIHSAVRSQFVDDRPVHSGLIAYRGVVPTAALPVGWPFPGDGGGDDGGGYSQAWVAKHRHFLTYPIARNERLNIVAFVTKTDRPDETADVRESWTSVCDRRDVEADFEGFDTPVQQVIGLMDERPARWRINDREPLERWHFCNGRVVLLGDAAHAMLPHLGAGAGQALEDGWVLARALADHLVDASFPRKRCAETTTKTTTTTLEAAMQLYQDVRRPRAERVQAGSRRAGDTYEMQTPEMRPLSFGDCLPLLAAAAQAQMKHVWEEDVDASYLKLRGG